MKSRGVFTISIDLELAWGMCDKPIKPSARYMINFERKIVQRILDLFSKYDIQATWAVVAHLLLTECKWEGERVHPEINRPITKNLKYDWFFQHPKNHNDPLWYGSDIIGWIRNSSPKQEIGSHSFCHLPYHEGITNRNAVRADIERAKKLHEVFDLPFEAFIFPYNVVGYRNLLSKAGICVYRGKSHRWYDSIPCRSFRRLLNLIYFLIAVPPQTVTATFDELGLVDIPDSMFLLARTGVRGLVSSRNLIKMGIMGLNRAVKAGKIFHLWFHPLNFAYKTNKQFYVLESILRHAQHLRERGQLDILTMKDIQRITARTNQSTLKSTNVERIRDKAITFHDKKADYLDTEYQNMAKDYFTSSFSYGRKKLGILLDETLRGLPKDSRILDIGCGTGEQLKRCHQLGFNVIGIEPSVRMRSIAQRCNPAVTILNSIITNLPFKDESFDFVMTIEVLRYLHHADIHQAYREMLRVLKPGGQLFFTMVNRYALNGFFIYDTLRRFFFRLIHYEEPVHCEFVTPKQIWHELNNLGIKEIKFHGRMFALLQLAYKINARWAARIIRAFEPFDDLLSLKKWTVPLAGHLIVIARRPAIVSL